ncbi:Twin-arginine translocation protein TatB [hydrothermal vent metagenome]|uniref:Twin-arginine translocation protein TatB n=1 Tax=hydrothermal vent metagenome TaxID=652676 RepID=A0A3B0ZLL4_9ZZZZ
MFDIGFWELGVIMIVALVVIGPDKLPGIARSAGKWVGKARYFIANVKQDVQKEMRAEELKQAIGRDAGLDELKQIMNTDQFTLEEEDDPGYLVSAIDDDIPTQAKTAETIPTAKPHNSGKSKTDSQTDDVADKSNT